MKIKIFYGILFIFLATATVSFAVGGIPPVGGYTPDLQEIDPDCSLGDPDCFVNFNHQGYIDVGTRAGGDLITIIGDHDDSNNGTKILLDDNAGKTVLESKEIFLATPETDTTFFNPTIWQNQTEDPSVGGSIANRLIQLERTANPSGTGRYWGDLRNIIDSSNDNSEGITGLDIGVRKTGTSDNLLIYGTDVKSYHLGGGDVGFLNGQVVRVRLEGNQPASVSQVMRGISPDVRVNNPNATVAFAQGIHPTVDLRQGTLTGAQALFLDFDVSAANLGTTLNFTGDVAYLQGGGGGDVISLKQHLDNEGHKLRFIWNQGEAESDFDGIINYNGDVSNIESASDKVLINKEWFNRNNNKTVSYTVATLPLGAVGDIAHVTDASGVSYRGVATGGGADVALVFFDGTNWLYH
jgi:hypothetical protein